MSNLQQLSQSRLSTAFSNPFTSISSKWVPRSMRELLDLCEWLYTYNGIYRAAIDRVSRIFYTNFEFEDAEHISGLDIFKDYLESVNFRQRLISIGTDFLSYGNCFLGIYLPFKRWIKCPSCNRTYNANQIELDFCSDGHFTGECACGASNVKFGYRDTPYKDIDKVNIIRFSPKEIDIVSNRISGQNTYYWNIAPEEKDKIRNAKGTNIIRQMPVEILQAAFTEKKISFEEGELLHLKEDSLAGLDMDWGTPFALSCFPLIFYIAVLRKANEAISMDYIIPLRILFPQSSSSHQEAAFMNLKDFASKVSAIIASHKQDPDDYHISPVPIGYTTAGGEKRSLMISDDIKISNDELLNSIGFPAELFYGTLNLASTPMALRMLENTFDLTAIYSKIAKWVVGKTSTYMAMEEPKVNMTPLKLADDAERRAIMVQLAAAQKLSDITTLEMFGFNYEEEQQKKLQQIQILNKLEEEAEKDKKKEQEIMQQGGGTEPGVGTPTQIMEQSQQIAQQMLMIPYEQRRSELDSLLKQNPLLHHAVIGEMDKMRGKMGTQGAVMMQQQMAQQMGGMPMG